MRAHIFVVWNLLNTQTQKFEVLVADLIKQHLPPRGCNCLSATPSPQTKVDVSISGGKLSVSSFCSNFGLGVWGEGRSQSLRNIRDAQVLLNYVRQPCQNCQKVVPSVLKRKSVSSRNRPRAQRNVNTTFFISAKSPCTLVWVLGRTFCHSAVVF